MVNKKILIGMATLSISSLLGASNSFASVDGFYLGGQIGWGKVHLDGLSQSDMVSLVNAIVEDGFSVTSNHTSTNNNSWAGRLYAGYQIDCHWAAELGWSKFSQVDTSGSIRGVDFHTGRNYRANLSGNVNIDAVDLVAKGTLPLENNFSLYGKLGVAYIWSHGGDVNGSFVEPGLVNESASANINNEHKFFPTFGIGVGYDVTPNVVVDLAYNRIQKVGSTDLNSTDMATIGIAYHFG